MMKGIDATIWNVCDALKLPKRAVAVYDLEDEDDVGSKSQSDPLSLFSLRSTSDKHLDPDGGFDWIATKLELISIPYMGEDDDNIGELVSTSGLIYPYPGIYWLNDPRHAEVNVAYTTVPPSYTNLSDVKYGNEPSTDFLYSSVAILFYVPPWSDRRCDLSEPPPKEHPEAQAVNGTKANKTKASKQPLRRSGRKRPRRD